MTPILKKAGMVLVKYFFPLAVGLGGSLAVRPAHAACVEVSNAQSN